jgi:signal transduction histidine kinase/CHASE3 domain sensor protein
MNFQTLFTSSFFLKRVFLASLFILISISAVTYRHTIALSESTKSVIHSQQVHLELEQLMSYLKDAETGQRGYIISKNPIYLKPYNGSREKVEGSYKTLKLLTSDNLKQQNNLDSLHKLVDIRYSYFKKSLTLSVEKPLNEILFDKALLNGRIAMDDIRSKIDEMIDLEMVYLKERQAKYNDEISFTPIFTLSLFLFTVLVFVISYMMINRDLKNVKRANEVLSVTTESINHAEIIGKFCLTQWDLKTKKLIYSDNLYRLLGCEPQSFEPTIENYLKFVHPEDTHIVVNGAGDALLKGETYMRSYRIIRKDGETRFVKSIGKMIQNESNHKTHIGIISDITEQHLANLSLEERNLALEKANAVLLITTESINHAERIGEFSTWQWDLDTNILKYSDNQYRMLGCEPQSFEPTIEKYLEFVHPEDRHIITQGGQEVLNNIGIPAAFFRIIRKDGQIRYIKSIAKSLIDINGKNTLIGINSDVTEQHLSNLSLEERNLELEQINKELASFNHVASHDLQEPLRKIQLFISRIEENEQDKMSEVGKEYFSRINVSALRMRVLIDDLLLFSRTNRAEKVFEKTDLNLVFQKANHELGEIISEKKGSIESVKLPILNVIPYQMEQLFINLISNSLKYSRAGVKPCVKIECEKVRGKDYSPFKVNGEKKYYKFTFTDNGLGFEQQNAENIFTLFHRLHHKTEYTGTGIGLSICKKIVENHAGFIMAEGRPNEGATFTFFLPE